MSKCQIYSGILQHFSGCATELTVFVFLRHWLIVLWEHLLFEWFVFVTHSGAPHFHFPSQKINFPANAASAPIAWAIVKFGTVSGENIYFRTQKSNFITNVVNMPIVGNCRKLYYLQCNLYLWTNYSFSFSKSKDQFPG